MVGGLLGQRSSCPTEVRLATMSILVIDVGTSGLRAAIVQPDASVSTTSTTRRCLPARRSPAWSSSTPPRWPRPCSRWPRRRWRRAVRSMPSASPTSGPRPWSGTAPRASPSAPAIGWQDLRTVFDCLTLPAEPASALAPNQSATKLAVAPRTPTTRTEPGTCASAPSTRWVAWTLSEGRAPRHRPHQRRRHRPARQPTQPTGPTAVLDASASRRHDAADARRLERRRRRGHARCPAGRRSPGSSATSRPRSSARAASGPAWPRSRSAPAACSTSAPVRRAAGRQPTEPARHVPDRGVGARRRAHLGRRGDHAVGRHQRRVAGRRPRRARRPRPRATTWPPQCDDTGGVVYVPALLGLGTPHVGLRGPRHAARPHPRHRPARAGAGRAGGRRPAGRRPGRGGRGRHRAAPSRCCGSTAA